MRTHRQMRCAILAILAISAVALSGCAVITIEDSSGTTYVRRQFGVLEVRLASTCGSATAQVKALGLTMTESSATLGWMQGKQIVVHPADCTASEVFENRIPIPTD